MHWLDVLEEDAICDVCGKHIKRVHVLKDGSREVRAGQVCAQRLCGGKLDRNQASRRTRWLSRQWSIIPTTHFLKIGRTTIEVREDYERPSWYRFYIDGQGSRRHYPSLESAKLAAFENF